MDPLDLSSFRGRLPECFLLEVSFCFWREFLLGRRFGRFFLGASVVVLRFPILPTSDSSRVSSSPIISLAVCPVAAAASSSAAPPRGRQRSLLQLY